MAETMTSRQRVHAAIHFEKPDRVPIDLNGMGASGIHVRCYQGLKDRLGLDSPNKIIDRMQLLADVEPEMQDRFHLDVLPLNANYAMWQSLPTTKGTKRTLPTGQEVYFSPDTEISIDGNGNWFLLDASGTATAEMPRDGFYFDFLRPTMAGHIHPAKYQPPMTIPEETLTAVQQVAESLHANTDKAILGWGGSMSLVGLSSLLSSNITQGSLDVWLAMLMVEKETAHEMMGRAVDSAIARLKLLHQAVGDRAEMWGIASDDAGTQRSELMSPDLFAEMIKPHYARLCGWVHENTNWKTYLHSCGSIHGFIGHWIDAGIDILNPVQISAGNMQPERLMEDFGGRIVFWGGGCDTQHVLPKGSPEEIRQHVQHNLEAFRAKDGGFVFTQVHNIQADVPPENVEAMLRAAYDFG
jgi:uroporphyrinogen decarboxylase